MKKKESKKLYKTNLTQNKSKNVSEKITIFKELNEKTEKKLLPFVCFSFFYNFLIVIFSLFSNIFFTGRHSSIFPL